MTWTLIIVCTGTLWAMLSVMGGERRRQLNDIELQKLAEAEAQNPPEQ